MEGLVVKLEVKIKKPLKGALLGPLAQLVEQLTLNQ